MSDGVPEGMPQTPDVSGEFGSELAALLAYYGGRIAAARLGLAPAAIIKAIVAEQTIATRALMDRWQAASRKQQDEKPTRPKESDPRWDNNPEPS